MASLKFHTCCWLVWTFLHLCVDISTAQEVSTDDSPEKLPRMLRRRNNKVEQTTQETEPDSLYKLPEVDPIPQPDWPAGSEFELVAKESTDDGLYLGDAFDIANPSDKERERLDYVQTQGLPTTRTSNQEAPAVGLLSGQDSPITHTRNIRNKLRTGVQSHGFQTLRTSADGVRTVNSDGFDDKPLGSTYQVRDGTQIKNVLKSQAENPRIKAIGGVGNPTLQGMPLSLDDAVFLIQSERTVTAKPIYGGVGAEFLPLSVDIGGIGAQDPNKEFFTIPNKAPYHLAPAPNPSELFPNFSAGHPDKTSTHSLLPATNRPVSIKSLINIVRNLTSQNRNSSVTPTPSPYAVNPHVHSFSEYTSDLPNFSFFKQSSLQPSETRLNTQEGNLHDYLTREYEENSKLRQSTSFEEVIPLLQYSPAFQNSISHLSNASLNRKIRESNESGINITVQRCLKNTWCSLRNASLNRNIRESDESGINITIQRCLKNPFCRLANASLNRKIRESDESGINISVQGCLKNNWCGLGVAAAMAFGTVSALAVPFIAPPVFGRRRKSIEYVIFSTNTASSFVEHYMSMLQNSTSDVPDSERLFFIGLHDSNNNSTRDAFEKVKDLILSNEDALLAMNEQPVENTEDKIRSDSNKKNQILIPDDILNNIQEKSKDHQTEFPTSEHSADNDEDGRTSSAKEHTVLSQIQLFSISSEFSNPVQTLQDRIPSNIPENMHLLPQEWVQNEVTDIKLNRSDSEILDSHSSLNPRLRVPTTQYIQIQKIGNNPEPFSKPHQLHQNEMHTFSAKVSQQEPLGSSGSILQRLSEMLTVNAGPSHTPDGSSLQDNLPINNIASQFSYNSRYNPISIGHPLPERQPFTSNSNLTPFSPFGLHPRPVNVPGSYTNLPNNYISDLRNAAIKNALPVPSNSGSSTELPQKVQSQSSLGYPSILLNLPVPFTPTHQVNQLKHVNLSPIPHQSKPHLPNSHSISNLLNRITRNPSRLNDPVRGSTTSANPSGIVQHSSSLSHQISKPSLTGPFQASSSSSLRPALSNKVSQLFTSNPYNSNSYFNPPSSSSGNLQVIPLKNTGVDTSIHAKGFYQSVCSAVGQRDVPDSDIIRFIREKCTIFQYTGII